ncbi:zinc finger protein 652-B-like [Sitodiplosis mosellana]|uniref:zinc finger protein 652-B-like n=1 Tax=Sitodiplosis mosellana TaxID=263140 RepID=UPI00244389C3|nr:zinc finger protein 652-B-like [Sitodiplosis mosellana]
MCFTIDQYEQACGFLLLDEFNTFIYCCKRCHCEFDSGPNLEVHILSEHGNDKAHIGNGFVDDGRFSMDDVSEHETNKLLPTAEVLINGEPVHIKTEKEIPEETYRISVAVESKVNDDDFGNDSSRNESLVAIDVPIANRTKRAKKVNVLDENAKKPNPMNSGQKSQSSTSKKNSDQISNTSKNISTTKIPMISRIVKAFHGRASTRKMPSRRINEASTSKTLIKTPDFPSPLVQSSGIANRKETTSESALDFPFVFECELCPDRIFTVKAKLRRHMDIHLTALRRKKCPICKTYPKNYDKHMTTNHMEVGPHKCDFCPKSFKYKSGLENHTPTHTKERQYLCGTCGKSFGTSSQMRAHELVAHLKKKDHKCTECGGLFYAAYSLRVHFDAVHRNLRQFKCDKCDKSFKTIKYLCTHKKTHEEKKLQCRYCIKMFALCENRLKHERRVHGAL